MKYKHGEILWQSHGVRVRVVRDETLFDTDEHRELKAIVEYLWADSEWHNTRSGNWFHVDRLTSDLTAMTFALNAILNSRSDAVQLLNPR